MNAEVPYQFENESCNSVGETFDQSSTPPPIPELPIACVWLSSYVSIIPKAGFRQVNIRSHPKTSFGLERKGPEHDKYDRAWQPKNLKFSSSQGEGSIIPGGERNVQVPAIRFPPVPNCAGVDRVPIAPAGNNHAGSSAKRVTRIIAPVRRARFLRKPRRWRLHEYGGLLHAILTALEHPLNCQHRNIADSEGKPVREIVPVS